MPPVGFEPKISAGERPQAARLLRSWVRIAPGAWIFVCCECRVLSGRGLCDQLITRPEESYRLCCVIVCDLETSRMGAPYIYDISRLRVNNVVYMTITSILNVLFSPSTVEGAKLEGLVFLEHDQNNWFYRFYQYHNNSEGFSLFFSRGEFFHSVDTVTTDIVLSRSSMELSESMELPLIITTTFGSGFQRDLFPWTCDWLTSDSIIVTVVFSQGNIYFLISFILPVPTILGKLEETHGRCQSFFMLSYKRRHSQRSSSNAS